MADWAHTWCFATTRRRTLSEVIISWNLFQRKIKVEILPTEQPRLRPRSQSRSSLCSCFLRHWSLNLGLFHVSEKPFVSDLISIFFIILKLICDVSVPRLPKSLSFKTVFLRTMTPTAVVMLHKEPSHFSNLALVTFYLTVWRTRNFLLPIYENIDSKIHPEQSHCMMYWAWPFCAPRALFL